MAAKPGWILRLSITVATVVFLAFVARDTLSFLVDFKKPQPSTFVIQALGNGFASPEGTSQELWVEALVMDGQLLRWDSVRRTSNWQVIDRFSEFPPLLYKKDSNPAPPLLTFQGRNLLAILQAKQWSGSIRVERDGNQIQMLDLSKGQEKRIVIESPVSRPSTVVFVGALILFGGLACWFGPIRAGRKYIPWLIFFLSVLHILFWAGQCVGTTNDSPAYVETFRIFSEGHPASFPPGYPILLGVVGSISGESLGRWVTLTQHVMVVVVGLWIYLLLRRILTEELAMVGGLLAGALPSALAISQSVMSETPTLFAMVGALYLAVRSAETGRLLFAILAGLLTGWAGTMRVVPLAALLPSLCMVHIGAQAKRKLLLVGVTVAVTAGVVLLPVLWLWQKSGQPVLANSTGFHLFNRVITEQKQLDQEGPATKILLAMLEGRDPRGVPFWETFEQVRVPQLSYSEAENLFRKVAMEGIRKDPLGYLFYSPPLAWKVLLGDPFGWTPTWGDTVSLFPRLENPPPLALTASSLTGRWNLEEGHRVLWPILCWAAIVGTFLGLFLPQRPLILALAWIPTGYLLCTASLEIFCPRYNMAIVPFVAALAMIPPGLILMRCRRVGDVGQVHPTPETQRNDYSGEKRPPESACFKRKLLTGTEGFRVMIYRAVVAIALLVSVLQGIIFAIQTQQGIYGALGIGLAIATILIASWHFFAKAVWGIWVLALLCCLQLGLFGMHVAGSSSPWQFRTVSEAVFPKTKWDLSVRVANEATLISSRESPEREVLRVDIKKAGTQTKWHIQLNQAPHKVESHHRYGISFRARADGTRNVVLGFSRNHDPWTNLGLYKSLDLNPEWKSFQEEFVATADDDNARIHLDLGGNAISVEFADVKFYHIGNK